MSDDDLKAIATYLKSLPAQSRSATDPTMKAGEAIYADQCSACHAKDGRGVDYLFPALAGSPNARSEDPTILIRVVLEGARSVATPSQPTGPGMPSFAWKLSDAEIAAVLTYVRNSWGAAPPVMADEVKSARASVMGSVSR